MKYYVLFAISMLSFSSCTDSYSPLIIGHRGARGHIAENTLPSIQKALDLGVDGVEIDIFRCASGELVVFHDATLEALTDTQGYIEQFSLDSLRKVSVLGGYQIPTLEEVLDLIDGKVFLNIELKGGQTALLTHVLLKTYFEKSGSSWRSDKILISSFNWEELEAFYKVNTEVPIAILTEDDPLDAVAIGKQLKAVAINPNYKSLNPSLVKKLQQEGFAVYPWTVNEPAAIEEMKTFRVDGIITDYPERISLSK